MIMIPLAQSKFSVITLPPIATETYTKLPIAFTYNMDSVAEITCNTIQNLRYKVPAEKFL